MPLFVRLLGAVAIIVASFCATLFLLEYYYPRTTDEIRILNAKAIMSALEKHHGVWSAYPVLPVPDSLVTELARPLVGGGFISAIPPDPSGAQTTRYASFDGKAYGLLLAFERGGNCLIEVRITKSGYWNQPKPCPL